MGEMWDAVKALDKSMSPQIARFIDIAPAAEAAMKLALGQQMKLDAKPEEILADYEIKMTLVKRQEPLGREGRTALKKMMTEMKTTGELVERQRVKAAIKKDTKR